MALLLQRALPVFLLAIALIAVPALLFQQQGVPRLRFLRAERDRVTDENRELERDVTRLRAQVKQLREDPRAVEAIARDQLGLVRRSEVVFHFGKAH